MKEKIAAVYCRFSSHLQRDTSIEDQLRENSVFADSRGMKIDPNHIYVDRCTKGTKNKRDGFDTLLKIAKSGKSPFSSIIVYDTSRFARTPHRSLLEANELAFYGINVYFVRQGIDSADKNATTQLGLHGIIDHQYIEQLSDSTKRGVKGQVLRGYSGGGSTFGYTSTPVYPDDNTKGRPQGYKLEINKVDADTIKLIFELYGLSAWSIIAITTRLNEEFQKNGIHKPSKSETWRVSTIAGILRNEKYRGIFVWNKTSTLRNHVTGKVKLIDNPEKEWVRQEYEHLRIINDELWDKVQSRLDANKRETGGKHVRAKKLYSKHLLTSLTKCGVCKNSFVIVSGGIRAQYGCSTHHNSGTTSCINSHKVSKFIFEQAVVNTLCKEIKEAVSLVVLLAEIHKSLSQYILDEINKNTRSKLSEIEEENQNLIESIKQGEKTGIKSETLLFELSQNEKRKNELEKFLVSKEVLIDIDITKLVTIADLKAYFEQAVAGLRDSEKSSQTLQHLVERIDVYPMGDDCVEVEILENVDKISSCIIELAAKRSNNISSIRFATGTRYVSYTSRIFKLALQAKKRIRRDHPLENPLEQETVITPCCTEEISPPIQVQTIDIDLIDSNPEQIRQVFDDDSLQELAQSIRTTGIISPIILAQKGKRYVIVAGERRYRASIIANRKTIPAIIRDIDNIEVISLIENIQREKFSPVEECLGIKKLLDKGLRQAEVASIIGKSKCYISKANKISVFAVRYGNIDKLIKPDGFKLGTEHLYHIASQPTFEDGCAMLDEIIQNSLTMNAIREKTRKMHIQGITPLFKRLALIKRYLNVDFLKNVKVPEDKERYADELRHILGALHTAQEIVEEVLRTWYLPSRSQD